MEFNEYQIRASETSGNVVIGGSALLYPVLGLANESGEVLGKIKKVFRDDGGTMHEEKKNEIVSELGDVLWYLAETARALGVPFEAVAHANLKKLASRKGRGVIGGSGDTR